MSWTLDNAAALALTDGGIETSLLFHDGLDLPCFASFPLLGDEGGRAALRRYFGPFLDTAQERALPFVLDTVTWRLDEGDPVALGPDNAALREMLPSVRMLGGCCGTDHRHVTEIITAWGR
jgi:S-methylmethionine-dependent homocysteine/selenocysteine methylase